MILTLEAARRFKHVNALTNALPESRWEIWLPHLSVVPLLSGELLSIPRENNRYHYFPISAVLALHCNLTDGFESEVALIGNEGILGVWAFSERHATPQRSSVQFSGLAFRIEASVVLNEFESVSAFRRLIVGYNSALLDYASQTSACYRHHSLSQQVARTILIASKRLLADRIPLTHDHLARILGVRREGVTVVTNKLKQAGVIKQSRGTITIIQAESLRQASCECLGVFEAIYDRLQKSR